MTPEQIPVHVKTAMGNDAGAVGSAQLIGEGYVIVLSVAEVNEHLHQLHRMGRVAKLSITIDEFTNRELAVQANMKRNWTIEDSIANMAAVTKWQNKEHPDAP